ncbi:MAG: hypothetical protein F6K30_03010 [Cyanothece sp. SIO2G6]|nr:hypothetical protein [Cyanothece sp. SIO2G6]
MAPHTPAKAIAHLSTPAAIALIRHERAIALHSGNTIATNDIPEDIFYVGLTFCLFPRFLEFGGETIILNR